MRLALAAAATCLVIGANAFATEVAEATPRPTRIAPQELGSALQVLATDRDVQVIYRSELVKDRKTPGASGFLTLDEALTQLLNGTGLMYRYLDHNAITIVRTP